MSSKQVYLDYLVDKQWEKGMKSDTEKKRKFKGRILSPMGIAPIDVKYLEHDEIEVKGSTYIVISDCGKIMDDGNMLWNFCYDEGSVLQVAEIK